MKKKKVEREKLRNLGPVSTQWLNSIDVYTKEDIKKLGPIVIYNMLKAHGYNVNILIVYALQGVILDCHWNEIPKKIKEELKQEVSINKFKVL